MSTVDSSLPVLESCEGCGACCFEQGAPPDYVALSLNPHFSDDPSFAEDADRLRSLPAEARELLDQYLKQAERGDADEHGVCCWYRHDGGGCRFYEWRPSTCRVFELNSPGCHIYRKRQGIEAR
jgi:Fe-S-cluster containining protein